MHVGETALLRKLSIALCGNSFAGGIKVERNRPFTREHRGDVPLRRLLPALNFSK